MGLAVDVPQDTYTGSGLIDWRSISPPAIYLKLSREEQARFFGLYRGSGGKLNTIFSHVPSGASNIPVQNELQHNNKLETTLSNISSTFNLTKDELAHICHVQSRKTLYNWIDGKATPRKSAMSRVFDLYIIAQAWKQSGFSRDKISLRRPMIGEQSLYDLLSRDSLDKELILFVGSRLHLTSSLQETIPDPFA